MRSILFFKDGSDELNDDVTSLVAPHLFLTCNYEPGLTLAFSADAKFIVGVLNLYKLVIDCSVINQLRTISQDIMGVHCDWQRLTKIIDTIQMLRTAIGHNVSDGNGNGNIAISYKNWLKSVTGKSEMRSEDDYEAALVEIDNMGQTVFSFAKDFISQAGKLTERELLIQNWEDAIFRFYTSGFKKDLFVGQVKLAYMAKKSFVVKEDLLSRNVAKWFWWYYCKEPMLQKLRYEDLIEKFSCKMKMNDIAKLQEKVVEADKELQKIEEEVAMVQCKGDISKLTHYKYQDYYLRTLETELRSILEEVKAASGTMYPHDIMQHLILKKFGAPPEI